MEAWHGLEDIVVLLLGALVLGTVAEMLRQHAIVGYLLAGVLIGPNGFELVHSGETVDLIAELGVALLLFTIGLEFSVERLRQMGRIALVGGLLQIVVTTLVFMALGMMLGWGGTASAAIGLTIAMSSTACVLRLLADRAEVDSTHGRAAIGVLLLQDAALVPALIVMSLLGGGQSTGQIAITLAITLGGGTALLVGFYLVFTHLVPRAMNLPTWARNRELPILLAVTVALGAAWAAHRVHLSPAMGAFLAGLLLGNSPFAVQIRADVAPLRTVLVTLFFASIGMLGDPAWALDNWYLVLGLVAAIVVGKALVVAVVMRALGVALGVAVAAGLALAQAGEFSFVLAGLAAQGNVIDDQLFRLIVAATILTLLLTPYLVRFAPRLANWIERRRGRPAPVAKGEGEGLSGHIIIVGFGPAGQRVAEALMARHRQRVVVVDTNPRNARIAERYGLHRHIGNATRREVLEHADLASAAGMVITLPDVNASRQVIHQARHVHPTLPIMARARYHVFRWELQLAGAEIVVDEEDQLGRRLAAQALRLLGDK